jgi:hypothetical protein
MFKAVVCRALTAVTVHAVEHHNLQGSEQTSAKAEWQPTQSNIS